MSESSPLPDPLEDFLQSRFDDGPDPELQRALFQKTSRVLARRRIIRRMSAVAALAACFVAGIAVGSEFLARPRIVHVAVQPEKPVPAEGVESKNDTAVAQEWKAFDAQENRAGFYFEAGRKYLLENQDYPSALRCYRQALDLASADDLRVSADDDWLLMSLKQARRKENADARLN